MLTRFRQTPSIRFIVLPLLVLLLAVAGCTDTTSTPALPPPTLTPVAVTPAPTQTLAAPGALTLFETPRDGPAPVVNAIRSATRAVDVEVYELSDTGVIDALIAEQRAGHQVRVLLNENFFSGGNQNAAVLQQLQAAGIAAKYANPTYTYTHEKALIVDPGQSDQRVLIMTMNLAPGYLGEPDPQGQSLNFGIVDPSTADVTQAEDMFNADWNDQPYSPPANTSLVISPVNSRQKLLAEIQGATKSIHFFAQEFEDSQIVDAVVAAAQRGIEVKGLIAPGISGNTKSADAVKAAGGQIRVLSQPYEHAKATLVDGALVYIGSINYTATSMDKNRELGILTRQADIASQMETEFASFWSQAAP